MTFGTAIPRSSFPRRRIFLSVALHCAVISLLLIRGRTHIAPMLLPGDTRGHQLTLTYLPGRAPQPAMTTAAAKPTIQPPIPTSRPAQPTTASPNQSSPASASPDSTTGADSLGTGNINIAYLDSFRSPKPDLSSLPRGVSGDVILDVTIDAAGKIVDLKKLSGVGYGIDESVIATVQSWVFHPATKDGTPVVSEQELHFHYEHTRNG